MPSFSEKIDTVKLNLKRLGNITFGLRSHRLPDLPAAEFRERRSRDDVDWIELFNQENRQSHIFETNRFLQLINKIPLGETYTGELCGLSMFEGVIQIRDTRNYPDVEIPEGLTRDQRLQLFIKEAEELDSALKDVRVMLLLSKNFFSLNQETTLEMVTKHALALMFDGVVGMSAQPTQLGEWELVRLIESYEMVNDTCTDDEIVPLVIIFGDGTVENATHIIQTGTYHFEKTNDILSQLDQLFTGIKEKKVPTVVVSCNSYQGRNAHLHAEKLLLYFAEGKISLVPKGGVSHRRVTA